MAEYTGTSITVWYVNAGTGLDGDTPADNTAQDRGKSASKAFDTIQFAFDKLVDSTIADGDEIRIMGTSDDATNYGISAKLTCTWAGKEVVITGANSSGVVDGTVVEINGDGLDDTTPMLEISVATVDNVCFSNLNFDADNVAQHCVEVTVANNNQVTWLNCQFQKATSHGVYMNNLAQYWSFINCRANNNGDAGIEHQSSNYGLTYKCLFDENAGDGLRVGIAARVASCVFHNNGDDGLLIHNSGTVICDCVFDGNTGDGAYVSSSGQSTWVNNLFTNNLAKGLNVASGSEARSFNAAFYNNNKWTGTGGTDHFSSFNHIQLAEVTYGTTADFDFTPNGDSSVVGAGIPTHYRFFGSTASDIGLNKWVNTEKISVF